MNVIAKLLSFFSAGTGSFNPYETRILQEFANVLPEAAREALLRRLKNVSLVQRHDGGREVNIYTKRHGRVLIDEDWKISKMKGESCIARFSVQGPKMTCNRGEVWLVDGCLFSLEFEKPTEHASEGLIEDVNFELSTNADWV